MEKAGTTRRSHPPLGHLIRGSEAAGDDRVNGRTGAVVATEGVVTSGTELDRRETNAEVGVERIHVGSHVGLSDLWVEIGADAEAEVQVNEHPTKVVRLGELALTHGRRPDAAFERVGQRQRLEHPRGAESLNAQPPSPAPTAMPST